MKLLHVVFSLAVVSFLLTNFPAGRLGVYSRFGTLVLLIGACLALVSRLRIRSLTPVLVTVYIFLTYSFITIFWTENVVLSFAKWVLYGSMVLALFLAGVIIGQARETENPFDPLKWSFVPMVLTSCYALARGYGWVENNFRGYSGNSNALGASLMLTTPWLIYELRRSRSVSLWRRRYLYFLAGGLVIVMMESHSRAALVAMLALVVLSSRQASPTRKMKLVFAAAAVLVLTYALSGARLFDRFYYTFVQKNRSEVYASREEQMSDSWEAAREGGFFGAGFGVSIGVSRYWEEGMTFSSVSREKGSSTFAIVEETGVIGLVLYSAILLAVFSLLKRACRSADPDQRFIALIATGYFCAALLHGQFEAWFLSFGPDVSVYWATLGLAIGALTRTTVAVGMPVQVPVVLTTARARS